MYKTVLKNEVNVVKFLNKVKHDKNKFGNNVYILGYGSLLYSQGWLGRGISNYVKSNHLIECSVANFKRGNYGIYDLFTFYGVIPKKNEHLNGVLYNIDTVHDWKSLMFTECIAGLYKYYNYRVVDVTNNVYNVELPKNATVHMVVNEPNNAKICNSCIPYPRYFQDVWEGVKKERSDRFINEFLQTGGRAIN